MNHEVALVVIAVLASIAPTITAIASLLASLRNYRRLDTIRENQKSIGDQVSEVHEKVINGKQAQK